MLIDGVYLESLLQQGAFPPRAALEVVSAACLALETEQGLPAGFISPQTVCLDSTGRVRLRAASSQPAVDVLALGVLLATLMLGEALQPMPDTPREHAAALDRLVQRLIERLTAAGGARAWRQDTALLIKSCLSREHDSRPSRLQLSRRLQALQDVAPGGGMMSLLGSCGQDWLELPIQNPMGDLESVLGASIADPAAPAPEATLIDRQAGSSRFQMSRPPPGGAEPEIDHVTAPRIFLLAGLVLVGVVASSVLLKPAPPAEPSGPTAAEARAAIAAITPPPPDEVPHLLSIRSIPAGALITVDGEELGEEDVVEHPLEPGVHNIQLMLDEQTFERAMEVGRRMSCTWEPTAEQPWRCDVLEK